MARELCETDTLEELEELAENLGVPNKVLVDTIRR